MHVAFCDLYVLQKWLYYNNIRTLERLYPDKEHTCSHLWLASRCVVGRFDACMHRRQPLCVQYTRLEQAS